MTTLQFASLFLIPVVLLVIYAICRKPPTPRITRWVDSQEYGCWAVGLTVRIDGGIHHMKTGRIERIQAEDTRYIGDTQDWVSMRMTVNVGGIEIVFSDWELENGRLKLLDLPVQS